MHERCSAGCGGSPFRHDSPSTRGGRIISWAHVAEVCMAVRSAWFYLGFGHCEVQLKAFQEREPRLLNLVLSLILFVRCHQLQTILFATLIRANAAGVLVLAEPVARHVRDDIFIPGSKVIAASTIDAAHGGKVGHAARCPFPFIRIPLRVAPDRLYGSSSQRRHTLTATLRCGNRLPIGWKFRQRRAWHVAFIAAFKITRRRAGQRAAGRAARPARSTCIC
mmetsp:Transcript_57742/g.159225  ORF Transcript_57742/g.159225 Transcript_57742/m.159225 type:complete len:222 (-) Transcript_57742:474-1139(-)